MGSDAPARQASYGHSDRDTSAENRRASQRKGDTAAHVGIGPDSRSAAGTAAGKHLAGLQMEEA